MPTWRPFRSSSVGGANRAAPFQEISLRLLAAYCGGSLKKLALSNRSGQDVTEKAPLATIHTPRTVTERLRKSAVPITEVYGVLEPLCLKELARD